MSQKVTVRIKSVFKHANYLDQEPVQLFNLFADYWICQVHPTGHFGKYLFSEA